MDAKIQLLIWTSLSLVLHIVATNLLFRRQNRFNARSSSETLTGILLRESVLFVIMIGIPFGALVTGASGLDLMALGTDLSDPANVVGFSGINWVRGTGVTAAVVAGLLVVIWLGGRSTLSGNAWAIGPIAVRDALYNEVHWTFYRAAPVLLIGDPFWGVLVGIALVLVEWLLLPTTRGILNAIEGRQFTTLQLACLLCSGFLYIATRNLWLMLAADLLIQLIGSRLISTGQRQGSSAFTPRA